MWCWGSNSYGQVGKGDSGAGTNALAPVLVIPSGAAEVMVGAVHTCARMAADNRVQCWGLNNKGQLGKSSPSPSLNPNPTPSLADKVPPVRYLAAGGFTTCGRRLVDDVMICWGDNTSGQLGAGTVSTTSDPPLGVVEGQQETVLSSNSNQGVAVALGSHHTCAINGANLYCWGKNDLGQLGGSNLSQNTPVIN